MEIETKRMESNGKPLKRKIKEEEDLIILDTDEESEEQ